MSVPTSGCNLIGADFRRRSGPLGQLGLLFDGAGVHPGTDLLFEDLPDLAPQVLGLLDGRLGLGVGGDDLDYVPAAGRFLRPLSMFQAGSAKSRLIAPRPGSSRSGPPSPYRPQAPTGDSTPPSYSLKPRPLLHLDYRRLSSPFFLLYLFATIFLSSIFFSPIFLSPPYPPQSPLRPRS